MAVENTDLKIVIEAVNKASGELARIEKDLGKLSASAKTAGRSATQSASGIQMMGGKFAEISSSARTASSSVGGFVSTLSTSAPQIAIIVAVLATLTAGFVALNKILKFSVKAYNEYETAIRGLYSVSAAFGQSQSEARDAAMSLAEDGLTSVSTAAIGLKNLMSAGLGLDQAKELMEAYKNEAAFGRANTITYDQAVQNLAESFKTENSMIGNLSGQTENYNYILEVGAALMGKTTAELTMADRVQAKYLGTLQVAKKNIGDASLYTDTYQGSISRLKATFNLIGIQIGSFFQPILKYLAQWLQRSADATTGWLIPAMKGLALVTMATVGAINLSIDALKTFVNVASAVPKTFGSFSLSPLKQAFKKGSEDIKGDWERLNKAMADIMNVNIDEITKNAIEGFDDTAAAAAENAAKLAKINEEYAHSLQLTNRAYEEQLKNLIITHRDAWKELRKDVEDEKREFESGLIEMEDEFKNSMEEITEAHSEKTKSILDDIEKERKAADREIEEINEKWNNLTTLTQNAGAERLGNLKAQLDKELALGENANKLKIASLRDYIKREETALSEAVTEQGNQRDEEIGDVNEIYNEKLTVLQEQLEAEENEYRISTIEKQTEYEKDVANYKEAMEEKIQELDIQLKKEEEIRQRYAEDFKRIGDQMADDDIATLKRKHEEELVEMKYQHDLKVAELGQTGKDAGEKYMDGIISGIDSKKEELTNKVNDVKATLEFNEVNVKSGSKNNYGSWESMFGMAQHGGIIASPTIVGEKNYPEVVLPLGEPQRMSDILQSLGIKGGREGTAVEQNFYVTVNSQSDVDMIMERASFKAKYL